MFSLQTIFGKGDKFYGLLEQSADAARESAKALHDLLTTPDHAPGDGRLRRHPRSARRRWRRRSARNW